MTGQNSEVTGGPAAEVEDHRDLFISYAGPDRPWAQWAAAQLVAHGYTVELDVWDWRAGDNFALRMNDALERADRVLALWSPAYFQRRRFTTTEWTAVLAATTAGADDNDPGTEPGAGRLIPVRVTEVNPPKVLAPLIYRDVFGVPESAARAELLAAVGGPAQRNQPAAFPGGVEEIPGPRLPGTLAVVWNLPARNPAFTGREAMLAELRERLAGGGRTWVQALNGMGGVGKTQLAVEYAYLFSGEYDWAWWIDAEQPELIGDQVTALAAAAGWTPRNASAADARSEVARRVDRTGGWLLIFDNVSDPHDLDGWLPRGPGHVIITSRHRGFTGIAATVDVPTFTPAESVDLLRTYLPALSDQDADALAALLGYLPLAITQAAGLLAETSMTVVEYRQECEAHAHELLSEGRPLDYPVPLGAAIEISLTRLAATDPAATDILTLASVLAPDPIPLAWLRSADPGIVGEHVALVAARPLAFRRTLARIADLGLAQLSHDTPQLHRLTQAVIRDRQPPDQLTTTHDQAARLLTTAAPDNDGSDPTSWPAWADLLPHLLALNPADAPATIRDTACNALWYLLMRGEYHTVLPLAHTWHTAWLDHDGPDNVHTLWGANQLARAHAYLGHYDQARALDQDALARSRRVLGEDHPDTLASANNLAIDLRHLGRDEEAYELDQDTLARRRRLLGEDHPDTLTSANSLAVDLARLGRDEEAYELNQDTLTRRRRVLGEDHPNRSNFSRWILSAFQWEAVFIT